MKDRGGQRRGLRVGIVALLVLAAFFALAPWLRCVFPLPPFGGFQEFTLRACTFGDPALRAGWNLPGFAGPYWGNLIAGIAYLAAALYVAITKRQL